MTPEAQVKHRRIHINEAVRFYNKTRQTFYNRIRKGYLTSKKINNKIYIHTESIEKLLSNYREVTTAPAENTAPPSVEESSPGEDLTYALIDMIDEKIYGITQHIDTQKNSFQTALTDTKRELWTDMQRACEGIQHQTSADLTTISTTLTTQKTTLEKQTRQTVVIQKKLMFRSAYAVILMLHGIIAGIFIR